uniref:HTH araC/xylS-type domain-containing protein n=1 Tax=Rhodococcus sp. NS1 TaxID=402236 RepID=A0A097SQM8_9NOCA|nr:hypothetical protein LRS1606.381 [Rhodococcus sp. NS1]
MDSAVRWGHVLSDNLPSDSDMTHRVGLVVFDGVTMLDVSGPAEVLHQASNFGHPYDVVLISPSGGDVTTSIGMPLRSTVTATEAGHIDTVLVAGGESLTTTPSDPELLAAVHTVTTGATRVASVCTGAFVLAQLGLLDGRRATTHWRHADAFARRYPRVRIAAEEIHVRDGRFVTSAGISSGIDLALSLVEEDRGVEAARCIARELVVFMQRPGGQAQFTTTVLPSDPPDVLRPVIESVLADPSIDHGLPAMARAASVSPRHLTRLFRTELGTTPARWVEEIRLGHATTLLLDGHTVTSTARRSGFGSDETLRRVFLRHFGISPTDYRKRFATTGTGSITALH